MKQNLQTLLAKEVDRKDFLKHIAAGVVGLTGITAVTKTLTDFGTKPAVGSSFGGGVYGGNKTR